MQRYKGTLSPIIMCARVTVLVPIAMFILRLVPAGATPIPPSSSIAQKQLELGIAVLQKKSSTENLVLSPYSIHAGLTLARIGAVGPTGSALDKILFASSYSTQTLAEYAKLHTAVQSSTDTATSTLANSIWISDKGSFTNRFRSDSSSGFNAEPRSIDFQKSEQARATINKWVSDKTKALIPNLLPAGMPKPQTSATLVNALYFKAAWDSTFQKGLSKDGEFWRSNGSTVRVPIMHQTSSMSYFENETWQAAQLSYAHGAYVYQILVPRSRLSAAEVARRLSPELIQTVLHSSTRSRVKLTMPRHKIRQSCELVDVLRSLGAELPFSGQADYSGMTALPVTIGAVVHEAVVLVDEAGTEAAAATAVTMEKTAFFFKDEPKEVTADHPFAFIIAHATSQAPLFVGVLGDPRL
jgi:serpin B